MMDQQELLSLIRNMNDTENEWHNLKSLIMQENYAYFLECGLKFTNASDPNESELQHFINSLIDENIDSNICIYTIAITLLLCIQAENLKQQGFYIYLKQVKFLFRFAVGKQLLFASREAVWVSEYVVKIATSLGITNGVINVLMSAASLLSFDGHHLTPIHSHIIQCCLTCRQYKVAANYINNLTELRLNPNITFINASDCLAYYYYCSLVFIGQEDFVKSFYYLNEAISVPSQYLSAIVISSIKKAKLISLLQFGERYVAPKTSSSIVQRYCTDEISPLYETIAKHFFEFNVNGLKSLVEETNNKQQLNENNDIGLVSLVIDALQRNLLKKISKSYINIKFNTLVKLCQKDSVEEVEKLLIKCASCNYFDFSIDKASQVVHFQSTEDMTTTAAVDDLDGLVRQELQETINISKKVRDSYAELYTSKLFVKNAKQSTLL